MSLFSPTSTFGKDTWLAETYVNELEHSEGSLIAKLGINWDRTTKIEGRNAFMKMQTGDDLGFSVIGQGGDYGASGDIASAEATLSLSRFSETITIDGHEKGLLDSANAAAAPIIAKKMSAAKMRTLRELERMSVMDGSGKLAKITSATGATITLDVAGNEYPERNAFTWIDRPGRGRYTTINASTGADYVQGFTLSSKVESTGVLTTSATQTASNVAGAYLVNDYGASAWTTAGAISSREFPGLLGICNATNTYLNINRSTAANEFWRAVVDDNSGTNRTFTETLARTIMAKLSRTAESGMVSMNDHFALASPGTYNAYQTLMTSGIRYTGSETPDIGWGGRPYILMEGIKLYSHIHAPRNMVLIVHQPTTKYVTAKHSPTDTSFTFQNNNGDIWFPATASAGNGYADQWLAYITGFLGMYSERPSNNAKLDDLTEVSGSY